MLGVLSVPADLYRGELTNLILATLTTGLHGYGAGIPVGDGVIPPDSGWSGEPNAPTSHFRPYLVVLPMVANQSSGPISDSQADWRLPYGLFYYAVSRVQVEWLADRSRHVLASLVHTTVVLNSVDYEVQQVRTDMIGGATRVDQTDPPYWSQTDSQNIWISKEL